MRYQKFQDFACMYASICEHLEINPQIPTIHCEGKIYYNGQQVYGNLNYSKQLLAEYLMNFIQEQEKNF